MKKFERTHLQILETAKKHFLKYGFERANLRDICSEIDLTTGAFYRHFDSKLDIFQAIVDPVIDDFYNKYSMHQQVLFNDIKDKPAMEKLSESINKVSEVFVRFIYSHFDEFKLLLFKAQGTPYENFYEDTVTFEDANSKKTLAWFNQHGYKIKALTDPEIHMLNSSLYTIFFEIVLHEFTLEEALEYNKTMMIFFVNGWKALIKILREE